MQTLKDNLHALKKCNYKDKLPIYIHSMYGEPGIPFNSIFIKSNYAYGFDMHPNLDCKYISETMYLMSDLLYMYYWMKIK